MHAVCVTKTSPEWRQVTKKSSQGGQKKVKYIGITIVQFIYFYRQNDMDNDKLFAHSLPDQRWSG